MMLGGEGGCDKIAWEGKVKLFLFYFQTEVAGLPTTTKVALESSNMEYSVMETGRTLCAHVLFKYQAFSHVELDMLRISLQWFLFSDLTSGNTWLCPQDGAVSISVCRIAWKQFIPN